jgi:acetylornithine deacetylase/succinyl-diaminopimelate desuccinylase
MSSPDSARMKDRLDKLVAINTENPPGREAEAAHFLATELAEIGFAVEQREILPGRVNVTARFANGPGPVLAFNSHMDVVPAGSGWSHPPFELVESGGRLHGRGACDAKGPIVAMLEAARMLIDGRRAWSGDLLAVFVADEEVASRGARTYCGEKPKIDFAVIGEPTTNAIAIAHKGSLRPIVRVRGRSAHSGVPDLGVNAILQAANLLNMLKHHHEDEVRHRRHELVGAASLTVTRIDAGIADNMVPDACELLLDRRLVPGESEEDALKAINDLLRAAHDRFGVEAEIVGLKPTTGGATETPRDHPVVQASLRAASAHSGSEAAPTGLPGACDLVHFRAAGAQGVVVGPGSFSVAHTPDEFVPVDEFVTASLIYRDTVLELLHRAGATA